MFKRKPRTNRVPDGRKYRLAIISLVIVLTGFGVACINPILAKLYSELVAAVLGILFVYSGGNVAKEWANGKKERTVLQGPPPPTGGR